jgi:hypothetical protein
MRGGRLLSSAAARRKQRTILRLGTFRFGSDSFRYTL